MGVLEKGLGQASELLRQDGGLGNLQARDSVLKKGLKLGRIEGSGLRV